MCSCSLQRAHLRLPTMGFESGAAAVDPGALPMIQIGGGGPLAAGASYGGFVILWFAAFLAEIGAKNKLSRVHAGVLLSSLFIFGVAALCCVALISNADVVYDADIPALVLANRISPAVGLAFAAVVFAGIYTSAAPLLWTGVRRVAQEGASGYKAITVAGAPSAASSRASCPTHRCSTSSTALTDIWGSRSWRSWSFETRGRRSQGGKRLDFLSLNGRYQRRE